MKRAFLLLILLLHELHLVSDLELLNTSHVQYSEGYVFIQIAKKSLIQFVFQNTPQRFNSIEISRLRKHTFTLVFIKLVSGNSIGVNGGIFILGIWSITRNHSLHDWVKITDQNTDIIRFCNTAIQNKWAKTTYVRSSLNRPHA